MAVERCVQLLPQAEEEILAALGLVELGIDGGRERPALTAEPGVPGRSVDRHCAERRGDLLAVPSSRAQPHEASAASSGCCSRLSASCSRVTTCADGTTRPCARSTAVWMIRTAASCTTRRSVGDSGLNRWYAAQKSWSAGRMRRRGYLARATSRPGSAGSTIGTEPTQAQRYSASTVPDVEARGAGAGELPVDEQTRVLRSEAAAAIVRQFSHRRSPCTSPRPESILAQLVEPIGTWCGSPAREQRDPGLPRSGRSTNSRGGSGSDSAHIRSTPARQSLDALGGKPVQGCEHAAEKPRGHAWKATAAVMIGPVPCASGRAQDEPVRVALVMHDRGDLARQLRLLGEDARTAASCASVLGGLGAACLTTYVGPARLLARKTQFRRDTSMIAEVLPRRCPAP